MDEEDTMVPCRVMGYKKIRERRILPPPPVLINTERRRGPILHLIMQSMLHNREKKRGRGRRGAINFI